MRVSVLTGLSHDEPRSVELAIKANGFVVSAEENGATKMFPVFCPERHVNFGGTFCLGLDEANSVADYAAAERWWQRLNEYLRCQLVADGTGRWPPGKGASHGDAGYLQDDAEVLAGILGASQALEDGIEFGFGPFGEAIPRRRTRGKLWMGTKGRYPSNFTKALGRYGLYPIKSRSKRKLIRKLVAIEWSRRSVVDDFWKEVFRKNMKCCGRASSCPLRDEQLPYSTANN